MPPASFLLVTRSPHVSFAPHTYPSPARTSTTQSPFQVRLSTSLSFWSLVADHIHAHTHIFARTYTYTARHVIAPAVRPCQAAVGRGRRRRARAFLPSVQRDTDVYCWGSCRCVRRCGMGDRYTWWLREGDGWWMDGRVDAGGGRGIGQLCIRRRLHVSPSLASAHHLASCGALPSRSIPNTHTPPPPQHNPKNRSCTSCFVCRQPVTHGVRAPQRVPAGYGWRRTGAGARGTFPLLCGPHSDGCGGVYDTRLSVDVCLRVQVESASDLAIACSNPQQPPPQAPRPPHVHVRTRPNVVGIYINRGFGCAA